MLEVLKSIKIFYDRNVVAVQIYRNQSWIQMNAKQTVNLCIYIADLLWKSCRNNIVTFFCCHRFADKIRRFSVKLYIFSIISSHIDTLWLLISIKLYLREITWHVLTQNYVLTSHSKRRSEERNRFLKWRLIVCSADKSFQQRGVTRIECHSYFKCLILASGVSAYSPVRNALWAWPRKKVSTKSFWTPSWNNRVHSVFSLLGPLVIVEPYRFKF